MSSGAWHIGHAGLGCRPRLCSTLPVACTPACNFVRLVCWCVGREEKARNCAVHWMLEA